jgi:hypothetical protein
MYNFFKKISVILLLAVTTLWLINTKNKEHIDFDRKSISNFEQETIVLDCEIKKGFLTLELQGFLYTNKDNFKFNLYKNLKKQVEVGANQTYFWYWSRDEAPEKLFYSKKEYMVDVFEKSFNIVWLLETLKNKEFSKYDSENTEYYIVKINRKELIFSYFIDKKSKQIKKYELSDQKNKISQAVALNSSEIEYTFFEKGIKIKIKIKDAFKNKIDESVFLTPFSGYKVLNEMIPTYQEPF